MKGSIFKVVSKKGRLSWRFQLDAGRDKNGERIRVSQSGFRLERDAQAALHEAIQQLKAGAAAPGTPTTLQEYVDYWLPYHANKKPLAPKTEERYKSLAAHVTREYGHVPLVELTTFMLDDLYIKLSHKLAPKTVKEVHGVIYIALKRAVKQKLIPMNPADGCDLPRVDQKEAVALSADQLAAYQQAASGTWIDLLIRLGSATGARPGELLALRWADLNWSALQLRIERSLYQIKREIGIKSTKTRQVRTVSIPPSLMEYLKLHRQAQKGFEELFGLDYRTDLDLIFAGPAGTYLLPSSVTRAAVRTAKEAGLRGVGLHTLRHTHASALLHAKVPITNVAKRLGHRDAYTTAKIYAHAIPDTDQDVAAAWDSWVENNDNTARAQNGTTDPYIKDITPLDIVV
jgi:integrase